MAKFGYLNQGNPIFIRDDEAQEMVNCRIDRGWLEFGEFKVNTGLYNAVPGRQVRLPSGVKLVIDPTARVPSDGDNFAARGQVRRDDATEQTKPFYVPSPTSACLTSLSVYHTVYDTDYINAGNDASTNAGQFEYPIQLQNLGMIGTPDINYDAQAFVFRYIKLNGTTLNAAQATWRAGDAGTVDAGKIIVTLAADPGAGKTLAVLFHRYYFPKRIFKQPGKYFYALTYDVAGQQLESPPFYCEVEITENDLNAYSGACFLEFTNLLVEATVPVGLNPKIKIYRIPFGGSEYLFVAEKNPGTFGITFYDDTPDAELGEILTTDGNTNLPLTSTDAMAMVLHKDKLFIATCPESVGSGGFVYFSKTGIPNEFPASFFFSFRDDVVAIAQYNENLVIITKKEALVLYGDDEDSFSMSRIDFEIPLIETVLPGGTFPFFSRNSARAVAGVLVALVKKTYMTTDSVILFNSKSALDVSLPIRDLLDEQGWTANLPLNSSNKNVIVDNRFYVFEQLIGKQSEAAKAINIVYDSIMRGFSCCDESYHNGATPIPTKLFKWRSKEFHVNAAVHGVQFNRWFYVRGKGKFTVEILGDGEQVTAQNFDLAAVSTECFQIKSTRYTTFSIRFVGEEGAQIHDWGVCDGNN